MTINNHELLSPAKRLICSPTLIRDVLEQPDRERIAKIDGEPCKVRVISPRYRNLVLDHYSHVIDHDLSYYQKELGIAPLFEHFGLVIDYDEPVELVLHNDDMELSRNAKELLRIFGVLIIRNAHLSRKARDMGHRNRFPQLNFHVDRIESQGSYYSMYTRDPFDDEQYQPRTSSTVFLPMLVGYLQCIVERKQEAMNEHGVINNAVLFDRDSIPSLLNSLVVEHAWDRTEGTGEISCINNCQLLHASYYPNELRKGYRIGVRYLS